MSETCDYTEFIRLVRSIPELNVDFAVECFGGLWNAYEKMMKLFVRFIPQNVEQMDEALKHGDLQTFSRKAHSMKGSLNQIGYSALGTRAGELEQAAKAQDHKYCSENYVDFNKLLLIFYDRVKDIDAPVCDIEKSNDDIRAYFDVITKARLAADGYDTLTAFMLLSPLLTIHFDDRADSLISLAVNELEIFNIQKASEYITDLWNEYVNQG